MILKAQDDLLPLDSRPHPQGPIPRLQARLAKQPSKNPVKRIINQKQAGNRQERNNPYDHINNHY
jgi:hypothetical protein